MLKYVFTSSFFLLLACKEPEEQDHVSKSDESLSSVVSSDTIEEAELAYEKKALIYSYTADGDSSLLCTKYFMNDLSVKKEGKCYYHLPFQSEYFPERIIEKGLTHKVYETFDSMMCEVGGNSAYDKYVFSLNDNGEVDQVNHFMAWYEMYTEDGEFYTADEPDYFLGHSMKLSYSKNSRAAMVTDQDGKVVEELINYYDGPDELRAQTYEHYGELKKVFYLR